MAIDLQCIDLANQGAQDFLGSQNRMKWYHVKHYSLDQVL